MLSMTTLYISGRFFFDLYGKKISEKVKKKENKGLFYCIKRRYIKFLHRIRPLSICTLCVTIFCAIWHLYNNIKIAYPQKERTTIFSDDYNGIDVSKYQGKIDWEKVASDPKIQFVYIKATEGARQVDNKYHDYVDDARKEGLKIGSYHYFIGRKPAKDQFRNFKKHIDKHTQDLIPMVDVEEAGNSSISRDELQRKLNEFMQLVKSEYGKYPLLYSQYGFYKEKLSPEFDKYFLFIARYGKNPPTLNSFGRHNIWQYTEKDEIHGVKGYVDLDRFCNGTTLSDIEL